MTEKMVQTIWQKKSQSPKSGQFNSDMVVNMRKKNIPICLNPLNRVNSILMRMYMLSKEINDKGLNPLNRVNSILIRSNKSLQYSLQ